MNIENMQADISAIVNDLKFITFNQVVYEAIMNALHANATEISINLLNEELDNGLQEKNLSQLIVIDNGDGFTDDNVRSFHTYRSSHKRTLGAKGIGRFLFLKCFEEVLIYSNQKKITFTKDKPIKIEDDHSYSSKGSKIIFNNPKDRKKVVSFHDLTQSIEEHFLAYFKLMKDTDKSAKISILENEVQKSIINSNDIPDFKEKTFEVYEHDFKINYIYHDSNTHSDGYYCADKRVVIKNSELEAERKFLMPEGISITYLLSSKYFNQTVNDERDSFHIYPKQTGRNEFDNLSWTMIYEKLLSVVKEIAKENNVDIESKAEQELEIAKKEYPFLIHYFNDNSSFQNKDILVKQAKRKFDEDKDYLRNKENKRNIDYQDKLAKITQAELAEYIFDRQRTIDKLKSLTDEKVLEKEIHDLFMKRKTSDDKGDYKTNNLWLFDDRFMTYDKVFSDKQIQEIFPELGKNLERPDILSIVSNSYDGDSITDIVIIELKRPADDGSITPARAEEQLIDYASYINANRKDKIRIWCYAFLKFDDDVATKLKRKSYNKIPTGNKHSIYYRYWEEPNTIINFMDYASLAFDADTRNKTFMNILKGKTYKE